MPKRRYERNEPTHEWSQIHPPIKDITQMRYELIRPLILWSVSAKERTAETGELHERRLTIITEIGFVATSPETFRP